MKNKITVFWFRRDLRLDDNCGLFHALQSGNPVLPVFIFDKNILDKLDNPRDRRVSFIHNSIMNIQDALSAKGHAIRIFHDTPENAFLELTRSFDVASVFTNHDYENYGIERDKKIATFLQEKGISFHSFKDTVIFEKNEVLKDDGKPYTVFTPYSRKWKLQLASHPIRNYQSEKSLSNLLSCKPFKIPSLKEMGFEETSDAFPSEKPDEAIISHYAQKRDIPSIQGTTRLGVHLRFGTVSVRKLAQKALSLSETFLNELIWRDFYHMISWHFPHVNQYKSFRPEYDKIVWRNDEKEFEKWCRGETGYPIVDAGMRELNATGFMHNRVRMITASFLCKHLLIDWRWGEAYFAKQLLDFDFAANNGGWQWAAGSGCDAAPYFRIFNPYLQTKKFDPELKYVRKWVPEFESLEYTAPMVVHEIARKRCLETYSRALKK